MKKMLAFACCTLFCHCGICPKRRGCALENNRRQHHRFPITMPLVESTPGPLLGARSAEGLASI